MLWMRRWTVWIAATAIGGMIFWLIVDVFSLRMAEGGAAGTLFGKKVPVQTYLQAQQAVLHQAILTHGDRYREHLTDEELDSQAWDWLIFLTEAKREGIRVSDEEVVKELRHAPLFQTDGQFDPAAYQQILRYLQVPPRTFEEEFRQSIMIKRVIEQVAEGITVSDEDLKEGFHQREDSIRVSFLRIPSEELAREIFESARQEPDRLKKAPLRGTSLDKNLEEAAQQLDLKIVRTDYFKRSGKIPDSDLESSRFSPAFSLKPKEVTGPLPAPDNTWLVVQLEDHRPADEEDLVSMRETLEKELLAQKRFLATIEWYQDLFKRANLKKGPSSIVPRRSTKDD